MRNQIVSLRRVLKEEEAPVKETKKNKTPENIDQIIKDTEKYLDEVLRAMGLDPKLNLTITAEITY